MNDKKKWRFAGVNFDHQHMGDLLRLVPSHPNAEIVGVSDLNLDAMKDAIENFGIPEERVFTDYQKCIETSCPDVVILCPATAKHAEWTEKIAVFGTHILVEKPFAATLEDADRMISAVNKSGKQLMINWPLRWYPSHVTAYRLCQEGVIGDVCEVHYYDGNKGPVRHGADKMPTNIEKSESWFYKKETGGGSLLDYLGYGVTLGTWFLNEETPLEVTTVVDEPAGLEVDEHSITVLRYANGLSKFETQWGTFTDPWEIQPAPKCGFVLRGSKGVISSYDYEPTVYLQTEACPMGEHLAVDEMVAPFQDPIQYFIHCLENDLTIDGPLSPRVSKIGQKITDLAIESARQKKTLPYAE